MVVGAVRGWFAVRGLCEAGCAVSLSEPFFGLEGQSYQRMDRVPLLVRGKYLISLNVLLHQLCGLSKNQDLAVLSSNCSLLPKVMSSGWRMWGVCMYVMLRFGLAEDFWIVCAVSVDHKVFPNARPT